MTRVLVEVGETQLYRAALICGIDEDGEPYQLGLRHTTQRLRIDFGEARSVYPMSVISNGPFEPLELLSFDQVLQAVDRSPFSIDRIEKKAMELRRAVAEGYQYTEEEVQKMVSAEPALACSVCILCIPSRVRRAQPHRESECVLLWKFALPRLVHRLEPLLSLQGGLMCGGPADSCAG